MSAGADDLCLLADLKAWLNISTGGEDALLQNLITRGSLQMLRWMNRDHIAATQYTENRDGNDALFMLTRNFPIVSVASVVVNNVSIPAAPDQLTAGYVMDGRKIMLRGGSTAFYSLGPYSSQYQYRFTRGFQNVQLVYVAGYGTVQAPAVPGDLQQAAIEGLAFIYKRDREKAIVDSESANGMVTMSYSKNMLPKSVQMTLDQFTRRALL